MILFKLTLTNPFIKEKFISGWDKFYKLNKHKVFEIDTHYYSKSLFELDVDLNWLGRDHAGPEISIALFGFTIRLVIYDIRHWDYDKNTWLTEKSNAF
jgi:hypothetical protein